ncbi:DUF7504 family protein [Halobacterium yunchengense]|uniref:DUF7504 family protein n=1 Tax=Halobacterium yunchengense TaxID=3108497 RepID=UPI00300A22A8
MAEHADVEAFSKELAALKRDGCNVLVVSDAAGRGPACERLLGAPELDRSHVFLSTAADVSTVLDRHRPRRTDASTLGVVDATPATGTRSAAAVTPSGDATGPSLSDAGDWYERVPEFADFPAVLAATTDALDRVAGTADSPGAVRLCVDGLDPFLDAVDAGEATEEGLFRFLHLLTSTVRNAGGMGHFHVSAAADDDRLATLEPLFGATLRVDTGGDGTRRQRWRLHESGRVTDWFEF